MRSTVPCSALPTAPARNTRTGRSRMPGYRPLHCVAAQCSSRVSVHFGSLDQMLAWYSQPKLELSSLVACVGCINTASAAVVQGQRVTAQQELHHDDLDVFSSADEQLTLGSAVSSFCLCHSNTASLKTCYSCVHQARSCTHSLTHSLVHPRFTHPCHSLSTLSAQEQRLSSTLACLVGEFWRMHSFVHSCVHSFVTHASIHSFIHSFTYLFVGISS